MSWNTRNAHGPERERYYYERYRNIQREAGRHARSQLRQEPWWEHALFLGIIALVVYLSM